MAGTAGLEPADEGVKVPCLTTWLRPKMEAKTKRIGASPIPFAHSGVGDGTRTRDSRNHNPVLYQLNYTHHILINPRGLTDDETIGDWYARRDLNPWPTA